MLKVWGLTYKMPEIYGGKDTMYVYAKTLEEAVYESGLSKSDIISTREIVGECKNPADLAPAEDDEVVEVTLGFGGGAHVIVPGKSYILVNKIDAETVSKDYDFSILVHDNGRGIPGNMNPEVMHYHGFRGSYAGGYSTWAEGLRLVKEIIKIYTDSAIEKALVRLSKDLVPDED